ncbi:DUF4112 domain-containing protein [Halorubrum kocurii]|uniref:Uncharacterized protein n=1 Tax=Halorubrum kocurii JCM 14978 TaxID=1230456 RepID=M0PBS3_9EURY|nr:DUF4112 domain-containing protein [Halorubrum kocurii]EMA66285.1 hypothetical protein C468_04739 [Halorubrum kocurii JCM 14978]
MRCGDGLFRCGCACAARHEAALRRREHEAALRRMKIVAHALDESVQIPGTNASVGIDPILDVVPVTGDLVSASTPCVGTLFDAFWKANVRNV